MPKFTMEVKFTMERVTFLQIAEWLNELQEKAQEFGEVTEAVVEGLPTAIDLAD